MTTTDKPSSTAIEASDLEGLATLIYELEYRIGSEEIGVLWRSINNVLETTEKAAYSKGASDALEKVATHTLTKEQNEYLQKMISNYIELWNPSQEEKDTLRPINQVLYEQIYYKQTKDELLSQYKQGAVEK